MQKYDSIIKKKTTKKYLSHNENLTKMYTFLNWSYLCTYRRVYRFHLFVPINGFLGMKLFFIEECSFLAYTWMLNLKLITCPNYVLVTL